MIEKYKDEFFQLLPWHIQEDLQQDWPPVEGTVFYSFWASFCVMLNKRDLAVGRLMRIVTLAGAVVAEAEQLAATETAEEEQEVFVRYTRALAELESELTLFRRADIDENARVTIPRTVEEANANLEELITNLKETS